MLTNDTSNNGGRPEGMNAAMSVIYQQAMKGNADAQY